MIHAARLIKLVGNAIESSVEVGTPSGRGTMGKYWSPLDVLEAINDAQDHFALMEKDVKKETRYGAYADLSLVANVPYVDLPIRMQSVSAVQVLTAPGKPFATYGVWRNGVVRAPDTDDQVAYTEGGDFYWALYSDQLWVSPVPGGSQSGALRAFYNQPSDDMLCGKLPGGAHTTTSLILPATTDETEAQLPAKPDTGAYAGMYLELTEGPGAGRAKVTAYDGPTRTATISPALPGVPVAGNRFAFYPRAIPELHRLLVTYAAVGLRINRDEAWEALDRRYADRMELGMSAMENRTHAHQEVVPYGS